MKPSTIVRVLDIYTLGDQKYLECLHQKKKKQYAIQNPELLCSRLLLGQEISVRFDGKKVVLELLEEDLLPSLFITGFQETPYLYKTSFGFISAASRENGEGRYCAFLKQADEEALLICTGKYRSRGIIGECMKPDGIWPLRYGIIENFFYGEQWEFSKIFLWDKLPFSIEETLTYLTLKDLTLPYRKYIEKYPYFEFFISNDWSPEFYRKQARLGFIAITRHGEDYLQLMPQLQKEYAVLDWENLHISRKVQKILNRRERGEEFFHLKIIEDPSEVLQELSHVWQDRTWLLSRYQQLIMQLTEDREKQKDPSFRIWSVILYGGDQQEPVAGELGYSIGQSYTSLTGFFHREYPGCNNYGKLQLILLARILEDAGVPFWNLGHPYMQYKLDMGAEIISRKDFLKRWDKAVEGKALNLSYAD